MDVNTVQRVHILLLMIFSASTEGPVVRISVPEGHYIIIPCSSPQWRKTNHMTWRYGDNQVIGRRSWDIVFDINRRKYDLLPDGSLLVKDLRPENSGEYYCNDYKVADLEVLTGQDYSVSAGRTILLPCKISDRLKQKWMFKKNRQSRRRVILLKFKNGTVTKEINDPQNRFMSADFELRIFNLQPMDAGEYFCNGVKTATLSVTTEAPDNTEELTTEETDRDPDENENKNKGSKGVAAPVVIGLFVLVLVAILLTISFWVTGKSTKRGGQRCQEHCVFLEKDRNIYGSPLQEDSEIHYASLCRQNWRDRPHEQEEQRVIYSIVSGVTGQVTG